MQRWRREILADEVHLHGVPSSSGRLRVAVLFPNRYEVGMANLALHQLYRLLAGRPEVLVERVFYPGIPEQGRPSDGTLRSLEYDTALGAFDVIAVTSSFELDWLNIPAALRQGGIEPFARQRGADAPLVIIGGPAVTSNPLPLAPFADVVFVGEVEPVFDAMLDALLAGPAGLEQMATLPGFYIPAIAQQPYIERVALADVDDAPTTTAILTPHAEFADTFLIETGRGCPHGCRFCLARRIYHPVRMRSVQSIIASAEEGLRFTNRIGLVGAAVADHPHIEKLTREIVAIDAQVSLSSLRAESITPSLMEALAQGGQRTITLAPETADEELGAVLGKRISFDMIRTAIATATAAGITEVKLYFMVGIPGETDAAALKIVEFVNRLVSEFKAVRFTISIGVLSPRPHTELARIAVPDPRVVGRRLRKLHDALRSQTRTDVRIASARWAAVQTVLGRGGTELAPVIARAAGGGPGDFTRAMRECGLSMEDYLAEQTGTAPWEIVDGCRLIEVSS